MIKNKKIPTKKLSGILFYYKHILGYVKNCPYYTAALVFSLIVQNVFFLVASILLRNVFNNAIFFKSFLYFELMFVALLVGLIFLVVACVFSDYFSSKVGGVIIGCLQREFYLKIQLMSHEALKKIGASTVLSCFSEDMNFIKSTTIFSLWYSLAYLIFIPVGFLGLFYLNWQLTVVAMCFLPITIFAGQYCSRKASETVALKKKNDVSLLSYVKEEVASQLTIRVLRLLQFRADTFSILTKNYQGQGGRYYFFSAMTKSMISSGQMIIRLGVLGLGGYFVLQNKLSIGDLIGFTVLLNSVTACVHMFAGQVTNLLQASVSLQHVLSISEFPVTASEIVQANRRLRLVKSIMFKNVFFNYAEGRLILEDISFTIKAGQSIAIIGASGSGKSTLLRLLLQQALPVSGSIEIVDGYAQTLPADFFLARTGVVFQSPQLFNGSIADNIRLGKLNATMEEIISAAMTVRIHDEILGFYCGYDTLLGEEGVMLSTGQCQRLAIARAIIGQPSVLILDEITSGLDAINRMIINQVISRLSENCTIVRVTHDLSEVVDADSIIILQAGKIISSGTHAQLLKNGCRFYLNFLQAL